jgi:hypothetical protein
MDHKETSNKEVPKPQFLEADTPPSISQLTRVLNTHLRNVSGMSTLLRTICKALESSVSNLGTAVTHSAMQLDGILDAAAEPTQGFELDVTVRIRDLLLRLRCSRMWLSFRILAWPFVLE